MKEFVCPSNANNLFQDPTATPPTGAFTNYKAVGASTYNSLAFAANSSASVSTVYGTATIHPDGSIFPGNGSRAADIVDGQSHTMFIIETIDDYASRWVLGSECTLTVLPSASGPIGPTPTPATYNFFTPPHFDNTFGDASGCTTNNVFTDLMIDYSPTGMDPDSSSSSTSTSGAYGGGGSAGSKYRGQPQWTSADVLPSEGPHYGPSSSHPAVVMAGFGDGSVQQISKRIDAANLFFLTTKNNSDPFYMP
jgi:hypothetical protein